jgi:hypothetical protein
VLGVALTAAFLATSVLASQAVAAGGWSAPATTIQQAVDGLSCFAPSCVAVGQLVKGASSVGFALPLEGSSWGSLHELPEELSGVSCLSASVCIARGFQGEPFVERNGVWTEPTESPDTYIQFPNPISCASEDFCLTVGETEWSAYTGGHWTAVQSVPSTKAGVVGLESLSCASGSPTFCLAVAGSGTRPALKYAIFNGSSWSAMSAMPVGTKEAEEGGVYEVGLRPWLSCTSSSFCAYVVGSYAYTYKAGKWGSAEIAAEQGQLIAALSCVSESFCKAITFGAGEVISYDGKSWSAPVPVLGPSGVPGELISCSAESICAATNSTGEASVWHGEATSQPPPPGLPPPPPGGGVGPPPGNEDGKGIPPATCAQSRVHFSLLTAYSSCFVRRGESWVSSGQVRMNGVDLYPQGGNISINPSKLTLSAARATVQLGSMTVYEGPLNVNLSSAFRLKLAKGVKVKGLPLTGELVVEVVSDGMAVTANAMLGEEEGANVTGEIKLLVTNQRGLIVENLKLSISEVELARPKGLTIEKAELTYSGGSSGETWTGSAAVALPPPLPGVGANVTITNGHLTEVGVEVSGIDKPIGEIVYLQKLGLDVRWEPSVAVTGTLGLSAGPSIPALNAPLAELESSLEIEFTQPPVLIATGKLTLAGRIELATAEARWTVPDRFEMSGEAAFSVGPASIRVAGAGFVNQDGFGFKAEGEVSVPAVTGQGFAYISEKGITGCAFVTTGPLTVYGGFGYYWGGELELWADSCGALNFKSVATPAAVVSGPVSFHVPRAQTETVVGARGAGGYPNFTLRSPSGQLLTRSGGEQGAVGGGGYRWVTDPGKDGTYVLLARPEPGTWTLTPAAGSPPIDWTGSALSAPPVRVKADIRARGSRDVLSWDSPVVPGQSIRFEEVGKRTADVILSTGRAHGYVTFTPRDTGSGETRHLQIEVSMNGLLREILSGPSFRAPTPPRPQPPRHLTISRRKALALITWTPAARAASYQVLVISSDGRRHRYTVKTNHHSLLYPHIIAPLHLTVTVTTIASDGTKSRPLIAAAHWSTTPPTHRKHRRTRR